MQTIYNMGVVKQKVRNTPDMSSYYTKKEVDQLVKLETIKLTALIEDLYSEIDVLNTKIEELEKPSTPQVQLFILDKGILNTMILG